MTVQLIGVRKSYVKGVAAVGGIDLKIDQGEFFTLLGPSGCGKTTTLRMVAGLESVSEGTIRMNGRDVTDIPPALRDAAFVFQSYALYPHLNVRNNLTLSLRARHEPRDEIAARLSEVSAMMGLEQLLDRKPGQLSGGQRQRVALGRALIRRPSLFLMDEPLSNLDLKLRERMRTELKALHQRLKVTTIYVTHDQAEALALSDRLGIMNSGELLQVGTPADLYDAPANVFVAKFIGSPSINLLPVRAEVAEGGLSFFWSGTAVPLPLKPLGAEATVLRALATECHEVLLGVRAELLDLQVADADHIANARVDIVEPMGASVHLSISVEGVNSASISEKYLFAVVPAHRLGLIAQMPLRVSIHPARLTLFDRERERAIARLADDGCWSAAKAGP